MKEKAWGFLPCDPDVECSIMTSFSMNYEMSLCQRAFVSEDSGAHSYMGAQRDISKASRNGDVEVFFRNT